MSLHSCHVAYDNIILITYAFFLLNLAFPFLAFSSYYLRSKITESHREGDRRMMSGGASKVRT